MGGAAKTVGAYGRSTRVSGQETPALDTVIKHHVLRSPPLSKLSQAGLACLLELRPLTEQVLLDSECEVMAQFFNSS